MHPGAIRQLEARVYPELASEVNSQILRAIPSIDRLLKRPEVEVLIAEYGRQFVTATLRSIIAETRSKMVEQSWNIASRRRALVSRRYECAPFAARNGSIARAGVQPHRYCPAHQPRPRALAPIGHRSGGTGGRGSL